MSILLLLAFVPSAHAIPVWDALVPGEWTVVSENTVEHVDPCPAQDCSYSAVEGISGVMNDWCGGALATGYGTLGGLVAWGGGHNGYFGSEIYVFDLATGRWDRVSEPYDNGGASVAPDCSMDGVYPDGSACPTHTYDQIDYHAPTHRLVIIGGTPDPVCGGCVDDRVHFYDFTTGQWSLGARKGSPLYYAGTTGYDPARDRYFLLSAYVHTFSSYDPVQDSWQEHGLPYPGTNEIDGAGAVDPVRDVYVFIDARGSGTVYGMPLDGPFDAWVPLETMGDAEIQTQGAMGFDWEPLCGCFVAWSDGADVFTLTPPAVGKNPLLEPWVWTRVPPASTNRGVPVANRNGTYSRFRYSAAVNAFVLVSHTDGPVWAYRLTPTPEEPGTSSPAPPDATTPDTSNPTEPVPAEPTPEPVPNPRACGCAASVDDWPRRAGMAGWLVVWLGARRIRKASGGRDG